MQFSVFDRIVVVVVVFFFCGFADEFFFLRFLTDPLTDFCFAN